MTRIVFAAALALLLAGCQPEMAVPSHTQLPPLPSDLRTCFRAAGVDVPERPLTVAEVERLWKQDRLRLAVMSRCGVRVIAFYDSLRRGWR